MKYMCSCKCLLLPFPLLSSSFLQTNETSGEIKQSFNITRENQDTLELFVQVYDCTTALHLPFKLPACVTCNTYQLGDCAISVHAYMHVCVCVCVCVCLGGGGGGVRKVR